MALRPKLHPPRTLHALSAPSTGYAPSTHPTQVRLLQLDHMQTPGEEEEEEREAELAYVEVEAYEPFDEAPPRPLPAATA